MRKEMRVFSGPSKTFKIDRKSKFASNLKSLISDQLLLFCPDYADDVLAEYITVLVCNGKNQNQARDDLEAFLGGRSEEFVSWLWHLLLKYELQLTTVVSSDIKDRNSPNPRDTDKDKNDVNQNYRELQSRRNSDSDKLMSEDEEIYCPSTKALQSNDMLTSEVHCPPPPKEMLTKTSQSSLPQRKFDDGDYLMKVPPSLGKHKTGSFDDFEKPSSLQGRYPASVPERGSASVAHSSHDENVWKRGLSPPPLVQYSHTNKPRRSVWDRLGKPLEDAPSRGQIPDLCRMDKTEHTEEQNDQPSRLVPGPAEQIGHVPPLLPMPADPGTRRFRDVHPTSQERGANKIDDVRGVDHVDKTISHAPSVSTIMRKRHFGDISNQNHIGSSVGTSANNQFENVLQAHKRPEVQLEASQAVISQVHDVKLRLHQIENEMTKLRSKQIEIEKDGKTNFVTNSGVVKPTEEDVESRTVIVTNVHYKTTAETLSKYFCKCGAVVNVVFSTDNIPLVPQRCAYITFETKESAFKALGLSGTSFYSRTITVTKKGETGGVTSTPAQFAGKRMQVHAFHSKSNVGPTRFPLSGSHLQWRRESLASPTCDQTKSALHSAFQPGPSAEDSKQCLSSSSGKNGGSQT